MKTINDERETHRNKVFVSRICLMLTTRLASRTSCTMRIVAVGSFLFQGIKIKSQTKTAHRGPILFENTNKQIGGIQRICHCCVDPRYLGANIFTLLSFYILRSFHGFLDDKLDVNQTPCDSMKSIAPSVVTHP